MLIEAIYPTDKGIVDSALSNRRWHLGEKNSPAQTLINSTNNKLSADKKEVEWNYARYWHGYLVFLKPLLCVTNPGRIRVLNFQIQFLLICLTLILIYKKLGSYYVLTYPLVSLGIPLCFLVALNREKFFALPIKSAIKKLTAYSAAWGFGYVGMWASKWILATMFTEYNVLVDAFYNALSSKLSPSILQVSEGVTVTQDFTFFDVLGKNFHALDGSYIYIFAAFILYLIYKVIQNRKNFRLNKTVLLTFAFVISLPFIWYFVVIKHSYIHDFLVYRELAIAIFGLSCLLVEIIFSANLAKSSSNKVSARRDGEISAASKDFKTASR